MNTVELQVQGMTCGSCVKHVTKALQSVPGVGRVEVDFANGRALVEGDLPSGAQPLIAALAIEDYPAQLASSAEPTQSPKTAGCHTSQGNKGGCCCK
jgi:copper chaperone